VNPNPILMNPTYSPDERLVYLATYPNVFTNNDPSPNPFSPVHNTANPHSTAAYLFLADPCECT